MPRILLLCTILLVLAGGLSAESVDVETTDTESISAETFRIGIIGAAEIAGEVICEDFFENITDSPILFTGIYWEVILNHIGFGMTYLGKLKRIENTSSDIEWEFDWIGSIDLRYHFIEDFFIDPFVEFGIGNAGRVDLPCNSEHASSSYNGEPLMLSIFFQAGGGVAFRLDYLHAGLKVLYRIINEPVPVTSYNIYPLYKLQCAIFVGASF